MSDWRKFKYLSSDILFTYCISLIVENFKLQFFQPILIKNNVLLEIIKSLNAYISPLKFN
jgi:hypothetical protein